MYETKLNKVPTFFTWMQNLKPNLYSLYPSGNEGTKLKSDFNNFLRISFSIAKAERNLKKFIFVKKNFKIELTRAKMGGEISNFAFKYFPTNKTTKNR